MARCEDCPEVGIRRNDHAIFFGRQVKDSPIIFGLKTQLANVNSVMTSFA
jgi:hypothetical protein